MQYAFDFGASQEAPRTDVPERPPRARKAAGRAVVQPFLPGLQPTRLHNFFLALRPPANAARHVRGELRPSVLGRIEAGAKPSLVTNLHVSLAALGSFDGVPPNYAADIARAIDGFSHPGFDIAFDRVMHFRYARAVVLAASDGLEAACEFRGCLCAALRASGVKIRAPKSFLPHMTLLYSDRPFEAFRVPHIGWRANEFVLIDSLYGQGRHDVCGDWPLTG